MLFVRCGNGGVSHSPREIITARDADVAARVMLDAILQLAERQRQRNRFARFLDRELARGAAFLAELVKVPSDNPPGDCAPHAGHAHAGCSSNSASPSKRIRCRTPPSKRQA